MLNYQQTSNNNNISNNIYSSNLNNYAASSNQHNIHNLNAQHHLSGTLSHHIQHSSNQNYQHPSLTTVFPSIYSEANFNNNHSITTQNTNNGSLQFFQKF